MADVNNSGQLCTTATCTLHPGLIDLCFFHYDISKSSQQTGCLVFPKMSSHSEGAHKKKKEKMTQRWQTRGSLQTAGCTFLPWE